MSASDDDLSLSARFLRSLQTASNAYKLPSIEGDTQRLWQSAFDDLVAVARQIQVLSLFSRNEFLEDVSTKDLTYMFVSFVLGEVISRLQTTGREERISRLGETKARLEEFGALLDDYDIVPQDDRQIFQSLDSTMNDPVRRREMKIKQYKREKEIKNAVLALRGPKEPLNDSGEDLNDFLLISSLLKQGNQEEEEGPNESVVRELSLLVLRLMYTQTQSSLDGIKKEIELLKSVASTDQETRPGPSRSSGIDNTWRVDRVVGGGPDGNGPLIDNQGRPLRPFTILPSGGAAQRAKLQSEVFRPDHRLPTMTIDDYLEGERKRGNILTGGGAASQNAPTSSEQLQTDAEQDGTTFGDEKDDERRQKDEKWARFADSNPKGSGNTMNRG